MLERESRIVLFLAAGHGGRFQIQPRELIVHDLKRLKGILQTVVADVQIHCVEVVVRVEDEHIGVRGREMAFVSLAARDICLVLVACQGAKV